MRRLLPYCFPFLLLSCRDSAPPAIVERPAIKAESADWKTSFDRGAAYLLSKQSEDGAWRSDVYGHFKHGDALTPLVIVALQRAPENPQITAAINRGIAWMSRFVVEAPTSDAKEPRFAVDPQAELQYPVYTAALTIIALSDSRQKQHVKIRDAWVKFLLAHQFTRKNGWNEADWQFGGWGYSGIVPKKPPIGLLPAALEANLSATAYALMALHKSALDDDSPFDSRYVQAFHFVGHCRNDDAGFFFTPGDPIRNKAGMDSKTGEKPRYRSYGSATADGLRCLRVLKDTYRKGELFEDFPGLIRETDKWLLSRFTPASDFFHHGDFMPDREKDRDSAFFYYAAALSEHIGSGAQRDKLIQAVVARQREDGSWKNELNLVREDDPIVATALAMMALRWTAGIE